MGEGVVPSLAAERRGKGDRARAQLGNLSRSFSRPSAGS
jgi:hypothetical protein